MFSSPLTAGVQPQALPQALPQVQPQGAQFAQPQLGYGAPMTSMPVGIDPTANKLATIASMTGTVTQLVGQLGGLLQGGAGANLMAGGPMLGASPMGMPGALPGGVAQAAAGCGCGTGAPAPMPVGAPTLMEADALSAPGGGPAVPGGDEELLSAISDAGAAEEAELSDADEAGETDASADAEGSEETDSAEDSEELSSGSAAGESSSEELSDGDSGSDVSDLNPAGTQSTSASDSEASSTTTGGGETETTVTAPGESAPVTSTTSTEPTFTYVKHTVENPEGERLEDVLEELKTTEGLTDASDAEVFQLLVKSEDNTKAGSDFRARLEAALGTDTELSELDFETQVKPKLGEILFETGDEYYVPVQVTERSGGGTSVPAGGTDEPVVVAPAPAVPAAAGPFPGAPTNPSEGTWYTVPEANGSGTVPLVYVGERDSGGDGYWNLDEYARNQGSRLFPDSTPPAA